MPDKNWMMALEHCESWNFDDKMLDKVFAYHFKVIPNLHFFVVVIIIIIIVYGWQQRDRIGFAVR